MDTVTASPHAMQYGLLAAAWILWCSVHSLLITIRMTEYARRKLGPAYRYYRLGYNAVALATVIPLFRYTDTLAGPVLFAWTGSWVIIPRLVLLLGCGLFYAGAAQYDMLQFLGIRQIQTGDASSLMSGSGSLVIKGVHRATRHPWYLATLLILWSVELQWDTANLIVSAILSVYVVIGTILEEQKLIALYGDEFRMYCREVSMLFPVKYLVKKI